MKIVDTFLFSEAFEKDLLRIKFELEKDVVDKWVLIENAYTFQGDYKGCCAQETIMSDSHLKTFADRIVIISLSDLINGHKKGEGDNFDRENWQRAQAHNYVIGNYSDEDWVIVSDTDEAIDFSDPIRKGRVFSILQANRGPVSIGRKRYWYDFDNECFLQDIHIPLCPVALLRHNHGWWRVRHYQGVKYNAGLDPIAFEYSYCFPGADYVWRKKCTYSHTGFRREDVDIALKCNHWVRSPARNEVIGNDPCDFMEFTTLTTRNSPQFVRDNLERLKTNIVDPNYKEHRKQTYPHLFQ